MSSTTDLESFALHLQARMRCRTRELALSEDEFNQLALELFALQFEHNLPYRKTCEILNRTPARLEHWSEIPPVPTAAFKEFELSCIPASERTAVFFSSGTSQHRHSHHFHNKESMELYETSLLASFGSLEAQASRPRRCLCLAPPLAQAPHSSLVHMFDTLRRNLEFLTFNFTGKTAYDGAWFLDFPETLRSLADVITSKEPVLLLGTAFSYVHLLDHLAEQNMTLQLPSGSMALETGGYKGRSRVLSKPDLHALITKVLTIPGGHIICEYGMSELGSQAYDSRSMTDRSFARRNFRFPPWARVQIVSPETAKQVGEGEIGLIRVFDLANVYSALAIQTEDLGIRRGMDFELVGRAASAEPRGCSLMLSEST
jgi:hypothetical protein